MRGEVRLAKRLVVGALLALAGCSTAGNEVMVFGTDTKVALDISSDPTGQPNFTLGYKRREAVWLPLSTGAGVLPTHLCLPTPTPLLCSPVPDKPREGSHVCQAVTENNNAQTPDGKIKLLCVAVGDVKRSLYIGTGGQEPKDAYSVMASFGLNTAVSGDTEIAQFFATGMAARNLTENGGAALVNTNARSAAADRAAATLEAQVREGADAVVAYVFPDGKLNEGNLTKLADQTDGIHTALKEKLKGFKKYTDKKVFRVELIDNFDGVMERLSKKADELARG